MNESWPPSRSAWTVAHRGASHDRPENTLVAFDEALRQRCDALELDLQLSRDGVPVVYHDRTLNKVGGGRRRVRTSSAEELRRLDAGAWFAPEFRGQLIPTLSEVLKRYARRTYLLLEIKLRGDDAWQKALVHAVVDQVRRFGFEQRVFLLCFDPVVLQEAQRVAPDLRRVLNIGRVPAWGATSHRRLASVDAVSVDVSGLTRSVVNAARRSGRPLLTFTCNVAREVERSLDAGAVGVMSDRPAWLRARLLQRVLQR